VAAQALGERLGQLAPRTEVAEDLVTARLLHGRGERPRPGHLDLEGAGIAVGQVFEGVQVLGEQAARTSVVDAGGVGEPPAGGLQVGTELGHHGERTPGHVRDGPAAGDLGQVRQVGQLVEDEPEGVVVRRLLLAGHRPDAGSDHHGSGPQP
jgi:hypothetical protein